MKNLVGKKVRITSDNENYTNWIGKELEITHADNSGYAYDECMYPQMLCDLKDTTTGQSVPFALYECEFQIVK